MVKKTATKSCSFLLERMTGIEPATEAWEASILPLNYIRNFYKKNTEHVGILVERETRLGLATPALARQCSTTELLPHLV